jgi:hypothetical protein
MNPLSVTTKQIELDDQLCPISCRAVIDATQEIEFQRTHKGVKPVSKQNRFMESFQNRYFAQLERERQVREAGEAEIQRERKVQADLVNNPIKRPQKPIAYY